MYLRRLTITLLLAPLLNGQEKPQHQGFVDCDRAAQTQGDLTECGSSDYKAANDELNKTYQQLLSKASWDPVAVRKIRASQQAWIAFRDAQIAALYPAEDKQREYGTVYSMCANLALADLTRQRTKMLKEMLSPVGGDVCSGGLWYPESKTTATPGDHDE